MVSENVNDGTEHRSDWRALAAAWPWAWVAAGAAFLAALAAAQAGAGGGPLLALWGALLVGGWLPLPLLLAVAGLRRAAIGVAAAGGLWSLPALFASAFLPEAYWGGRRGTTLGDFLEFVLVGGGLGLVLGTLALAFARRALQPRRTTWWRALALPLAAALAGVSFYPLVAATPVGAFVARERYVRSGGAAADAAEAARPVLPLDEQLAAAAPEMRRAFPAGEILEIATREEDPGRQRLGVGVLSVGRPKRWCVVLRERPGERGSTPHALHNGAFDAQPFSARVGSCGGNVGPLPTILAVADADRWPWLTPEAAVGRAEDVGGRAFRQARAGRLIGLSIRGDADGRVKWQAHYSTPGRHFLIVLLDAASGETLCAEEAATGAAEGRHCYWRSPASA